MSFMTDSLLNRWDEIVVSVILSCEFVTQIEAGKGQGSAGMLFFTVAGKVCRIAQLGFNFLLTVAVVVVSDQSHHHA